MVNNSTNINKQLTEHKKNTTYVEIYVSAWDGHTNVMLLKRLIWSTLLLYCPCLYCFSSQSVNYEYLLTLLLYCPCLYCFSCQSVNYEYSLTLLLYCPCLYCFSSQSVNYEYALTVLLYCPRVMVPFVFVIVCAHFNWKPFYSLSFVYIRIVVGDPIIRGRKEFHKPA